MTLGILLGLMGCNDKDKPDPVPPDPPPGPTVIGKAQVWLTKGDKTKLFNREADLSIVDSLTSDWPVIIIDTATTFQFIEGFGAALTGSSAYLIHQKMDAATRPATLADLFDPANGIGISYLRLTMGASDFSLYDFSYDDMPAGQTDFNLEHFSLAQDLDDVVPVLQDILQIAPGISLMGSPWSPPAWMKTNGSMKGGRLKQECYDVYARYFARYIREMQLQGIPVTAVTPQNEPLHFTAGYPCMEMQAEEQRDFIKNHLGPVFEKEGIQAKIIIYDHNWDVTDFAISILNDPVARQYIAGSAFHAYAGNVQAMTTVHNAHPDKDLCFTEISGGEWATDFSSNLMWYMSNILIGTVQNWSTTVLFWNLVLNEDHGPQNNGCTNCRGVITYQTFNGSVVKNEEYYSIAHFSKFVRPGAKRVSAIKSGILANVDMVAFLNTDGSKVLVVANYTTDFKTFSVKQAGHEFNYSLPGFSVVTIVW